MYCFYCGKTIDDREVFCPYCGKKLWKKVVPNSSSDEDVIENYSIDDKKVKNDKVKKARKGKKIVVIISAVVIVLVGLGVGGYLFYINNNIDPVNLEAMFPKTEKGYHDFGTMKKDISISKSKITQYMNTIHNKDKRALAEQILSTVVYHPNKCEKLSNGDKVKIKVEYNKSLNSDNELEIIDDNFTYTVSKLEQGDDIVYPKRLFEKYREDFLLPYSDTRQYSEQEIDDALGTSIENEQRAINEIYARHGRNFAPDDWTVDFTNCKWYTPAYSSKTFKEEWITKVEKTNISSIREHFNSMLKCAKCGCFIEKGTECDCEYIKATGEFVWDYVPEHDNDIETAIVCQNCFDEIYAIWAD